jgi:hypothetical protein
MFRRNAKPSRHLYLVAGPRGTRFQGEKKMNALRLAAYPANATVADGVTLLVSTWFLVAGAAILSDPSSVYTQRTVAKAPAAVQVVEIAQPATLAIAPDARLSIVVEAPREIAPDAHLTIVVEAKRAPNRFATRSDTPVSL